MSSSSHRIWLGNPTPIEGAPGNLTSITVSLVPSNAPQLVMHWRYALRDGQQLMPYGMEVKPAPGIPPEQWPQLSATSIRDLPLTKLERAARLVASASLKTPGGEPLPFGAVPSPESIPALAREQVNELYPDLSPDSGPGAARRWQRLIRLAEVVLEQQVAQAKGEKSPASAIAKARGVAPATVRSWLHQAKQEGFSPEPAFADFAVIAMATEANEDR